MSMSTVSRHTAEIASYFLLRHEHGTLAPLGEYIVEVSEGGLKLPALIEQIPLLDYIIPCF